MLQGKQTKDGQNIIFTGVHSAMLAIHKAMSELSDASGLSNDESDLLLGFASMAKSANKSFICETEGRMVGFEVGLEWIADLVTVSKKARRARGGTKRSMAVADLVSAVIEEVLEGEDQSSGLIAVKDRLNSIAKQRAVITVLMEAPMRVQ